MVFLDRFAGGAEEHGFLDPLRRLDVDVDLAEALILTEDFDRAAEVIERLERPTVGAGSPLVRGQHRRALAQLVAHRDGAHVVAEPLAREAVELHGSGPFPVEHGRSLAALAEVHRLGGCPDDAEQYRVGAA